MGKPLRETFGKITGIVAIIVWIIASVDTIKSDMKVSEYYDHPYKFADSLSSICLLFWIICILWLVLCITTDWLHQDIHIHIDRD